MAVTSITYLFVFQDEVLRVFHVPPEPNKFYLCHITETGGVWSTNNIISLFIIENDNQSAHYFK